MSFRNMLFVGDGTGPESLNALRQAIRAARAAGARMSVLDVVADLQTNDEELRSHAATLGAKLIEERETTLRRLVDEAGGGPDVKVVAGKGIDEIVRAVSAEGFDLVAKSSISGRLSHMIWGALDLKLLRACPAPVWLIRDDHAETVARVVVAVDATGESGFALRILRMAADFATRMGAALHVVTVAVTDQWLYPGLGGDANRSTVRRDFVDRFHALLDEVPMDLTDVILEGMPAECILDYANPDDLVVAGTHRCIGVGGQTRGLCEPYRTGLSARLDDRVHGAVTRLDGDRRSHWLRIIYIMLNYGVPHALCPSPVVIRLSKDSCAQRAGCARMDAVRRSPGGQLAGACPTHAPRASPLRGAVHRKDCCHNTVTPTL
ncbi:MAG: hypothetical protein CMQ24_15790 [Gammaproteobacteria bacterium]|nr:hypothetical protein [Gammaproteobacteria bacterium]